MGEVSVSIEDGVAVLAIDRPQSRNAIGLATMTEFACALDEVDADERARVLVVHGGGTRAFVSGGDLKELAAIRDEPAAARMADTMRRQLDRLASFRVPVIAAVNGHALGGGAEVACAADFRIAADDVEIGFTQVRLGIIPAWGGIERLVNLVGRSRAMLLIGSGMRLPAAAAERIGLVEMVTPRADFESTWREVADGFARLAPGTTAAIKSVVDGARPHVHPSTRDAAVGAFARLWVADAHWNAVTAATVRPA